MNSYKDSENGRSMVEMLGVLAIVGVLSIVGLNGYTKAMNRYHANELLNEAAKRAVLVAGSFLNGDGNNLPQFDETPMAGGKFKSNVTSPADGKFAIEIDGVDDDLCNLVKELAGPIVQNIAPENCSGDNNNMILTYNNDLSTNNNGQNTGGNTGGNTSNTGTSTEDGWTGNEPGANCEGIDRPTVGQGQTACSVCLKTGENTSDWFDSNAMCGTDQVCNNGICTEALTGDGCLKNSDCKTLDPENCGNGKCFCNYDENVDAETGPTGKNGSCINMDEYDELHEHYVHYYELNENDDGIDGILSVRSYDWFSANNFCQAMGMHMVSLAELGFSKSQMISKSNQTCSDDPTKTSYDRCNFDWSKYETSINLIHATATWTSDTFGLDKAFVQGKKTAQALRKNFEAPAALCK